MHGPLLGEFRGTTVLVLLGDEVVANIVLKSLRAKGQGGLFRKVSPFSWLRVQQESLSF
jgi:glycerol uptake facilitator-like aquaporin